MDFSSWQSTISANTPAIIGFMGACLVITLVGAIVRAVTSAFGSSSSDDD
jgi:hypothetical protein